MVREYITRRSERGWEYQCNKCGRVIGDDWGDSTEVLDKCRGLNDGEHECSFCQQERKNAYDRYVDPFGCY